MPAASAAQGITCNPDRGLGLGFLLGAEYDRKKQKLQQELQLDYKHYVAKKKDQKAELHPQSQGLSLPIDERISVKEKLREERNKEYNLFLQTQPQTRRLKRGTSSVNDKPGRGQASDVMCISTPASPLPVVNSHTNIDRPRREHAASRRNAATLTEAENNRKKKESTESWGQGHQGRRRWHVYRPKEHYSSEDELKMDKDKELDLRHRRWQDTPTPEPEYKEERRTLERRAKRAPQDITEMEARGVHDQNNNDKILKSDSLQMPDSMKTATRSTRATSKDEAKFATGLMIGSTEEQMASQMRKERYRQELLKQIAEQQRNKKTEKELELKVVATGATNPEKKPDRIKQFGAVNRRYESRKRDVPYKPETGLEVMRKDPNPKPKADIPIEDTEQRAPPGKPLPSLTVGNNTVLNQLPGSRSEAAQGGPSLDYFNEDYHSDFSDMLEEVAIPRVAGVPPPLPTTVANTYKTPHDAAYNYYGTRNPLDPNPPDYQNGLPGGVQQSGNFHNNSQRPPSARHSRHTEATDHHRASPLFIGELLVDNSKQRREIAINYQEALRQQIKEREERKKREKEEKERYDAKINAEMMAYNPWGRSGGGAPIKDRRGNLVSDLNHMHRINEESCKMSANDGQIQDSVTRDGHTPGFEASSPLSHRMSGFTDLPTPQQLHRHDIYKEALKQQIEENRRKQSEERERVRIEEEKEEKRLAEQRARIQQEYEDEQRRQKKIGHRLENQGWIHEGKTIHGKEEKRVREEQEIEKKEHESTKVRQEERAPMVEYERDPSPPIPTLQKKQTDLVASRSSSALSELSSRTERSMSAPPSLLLLAPDDKQEVMRELSALRRYLRKKQRQLEDQLRRTDWQEAHYTAPNRPKGQPTVDTFESANKQAVQPSTKNPSSSAAMQNIREFNQLKYRDTVSREEVRHMFPDPPTDAGSLDIQQQALLREQRRKIRLMKREEEHGQEADTQISPQTVVLFNSLLCLPIDYLDHQLSHHHPRNKPGHRVHRDSILPSETAFIDVYSGDPSGDMVHQQRSLQPSPEHQKRTARRRRHDYDPAQSLQSETSLNLGSEVRPRNQQHRVTHGSCTGDHGSRSEGLSGDEHDVLSLRSAPGRSVSVETVATEAWLRPGTSDAVKYSGCKDGPGSRRDAPPWLTHRVT
ncbi:centrosome and spindle pole-associated protein 1 [Scomber scombrus]|uniref:centrosome and spindle pole-associated protein 1 n=1 Tax=Scomber scombrus TaxID=13677 RepID=UPI002DD84A2D|nr:centrosome and spindle pole-associated protein 1 [Scomber scombrus]